MIQVGRCSIIARWVFLGQTPHSRSHPRTRSWISQIPRKHVAGGPTKQTLFGQELFVDTILLLLVLVLIIVPVPSVRNQAHDFT